MKVGHLQALGFHDVEVVPCDYTHVLLSTYSYKLITLKSVSLDLSLEAQSHISR